MNQNQQLNGKIAVLETKVDMLEAELSYIDTLLLRCGFPQGIHTLKLTVEELLSENPQMIEKDHQEML